MGEFTKMIMYVNFMHDLFLIIFLIVINILMIDIWTD